MPHNTLQKVTVDGREVDVAPLESINYARLISKDPLEIEKLIQVCQKPGIFWLDLRDEPTKEWLAELKELYAVSETYFDQPKEVKMKTFDEQDDGGYKPGEHEETFEIFRDDILKKQRTLPGVLGDRSQLLEQFSSTGYSVVHTLLSSLSGTLNTESDKRLEDFHRDGEPSGTGLKLVYEPLKHKKSDVVDNKHNDMGTLTLVFSDQWGVEIEMPDTKEWGFVVPKEGHALVNVADSLQAMSKGKLHSPLHRVTQPSDGFEKRYYVVYFLRPEKAAKF
ncbi:b99b15e1-841e-4402-92d6-7b9691663bd4 [Sclerotinia trifoliorum]|uniref:B99b15e1-841e-4402-92d6-7b9691663bd4 n=1 Tax=Sclerotinia trifoliorum TaxID=28548 RepID=A0A8H2ZS85_9HELO|nr:b99b15e1-841e-4402-92d6-7b9691663bd4 [Sclerotinia trifoliorum]